MHDAFLLSLDPATTQVFEKISERLSRAGLGLEPELAAMGPHLTLCEFNSLDQGMTASIARQQAAVPVPQQLAVLPADAFIEDARHVLYLPVTKTRELATYQAELLSTLKPAISELSAYHTRDKWVPHLTLGMYESEADFERAKALVDGWFEPFQIRFDALLLYGCCPYQLMARHPLEVL